MKILLWLFLPVLFYACGFKSEIESFVNLKDELWANDDTIKIEFEIEKSDNYKLDLLLRTSSDYKLANIWCVSRVRDSIGVQILQDTINIMLSDVQGNWLGKRGMLNLNSETITKSYMYLPKGKYTFEIRHAMRIKKLSGVNSIGLRVNKSKT